MKAIEFGDDFERHEKNNDFTFPNEMAALRRFLVSDQAKFNIDFFTLEKLWYAFSETRCANFLTVDNETYNDFKEWVRDISSDEADRMNYYGEIMPTPYRPWDD